MKKRMLIKGLLTASCLSLTGCSYFYPADPAMEAFVHGDYLVAYAKLEHRARLGDLSAQYAVGYMNYYGLGVSEDRDLALNWFKASARFGYVPARQALRILTHDAYKAEVNVAAVKPQFKPTEFNNVSWIRSQNPNDYTVEVTEPVAAKKLEQSNYPLVSYRYKDQDNIQKSWIYGDFKTQEQAQAISNALSQQMVPTGEPQYFVHAGSMNSEASKDFERVCLNTQEWSTEFPGVLAGPFLTIEQAQEFQKGFPGKTSLNSYQTHEPLKVALRSLKDIQLAMLP